MLSSLLKTLVTCVLCYGALLGYKSCQQGPQQWSQKSLKDNSALGNISDLSSESPSESAEGILEQKLPNGSLIRVPKQGFEDKLLQALAQKKESSEDLSWINFDRIHFETNSSTLSEDSKEQVSNLSKILNAYSSINIKIGGYTDNRGRDVFNQKLSEERANSVKEALIAEGISEARLSSKGYGAQHPVASNETEEGRAQNRRIAVKVTSD